MPNLQFLYIYSNEIASVDGNAFAGLTRMRVLFLQSNKLTYLDGGLFKDMQILFSLALDSNLFQNASADSLTAAFSAIPSTSLFSITLRGNDIYSMDNLQSLCANNTNCKIV